MLAAADSRANAWDRRRGAAWRDAAARRRLADVAIQVPSRDTQLIQQVHLVVEHLICELVERDADPMTLTIAFAQLNPTVGDVAGNAALVRRARDEAAAQGADLVVFLRARLVGYPPEDLVLRPALVEAAAAALRDLEREAPHRATRPRRHAAVAARRLPAQRGGARRRTA